MRAGSRTPAAVKGLPDGTEVVPLDLAGPHTFAPALEGVDKVFLYCEPRGIEAFTAAARDAGVSHLTVLSSASVIDGRPPANPIAAHHARVEEVVAASGLPCTFVRVGSLATSALNWAAQVRTGVVRGPYARSEAAPAHEADVAAVAAAALTGSGHTGRRYGHGSRVAHPAPAGGNRRGRRGAVRTVRGGTARRGARGTARRHAAGVRGHRPVLSRRRRGPPGPVEDTVLRVTGAPARTFAQWAAEHSADFR